MSHPLDDVAGSIAKQDPESFDRLYEYMSDRLFRFALRFVSDEEDAQDAVQQAFLELARTAEHPRNGRTLEAWLFASLRYNCIDVLRSRSRRPEVPHEYVPEIDGEDRYELGIDPELERALARLTLPQRQLVHLKYVEDLDGQQIADIMGMSRVAVYAMCGRAERRLKTLLMQLEDEQSLRVGKGFRDER